MLSRFWYFVVAALVGVGLAAAFVAQGSLNQLHTTRLEEQLVRDRAELELWLRYDARVRVDAIAPMAANAEVRGALREASARRTEAVASGLRSRLSRTLVSLNGQLEEGAGQLVLAVDRAGTIIAQLGGGDAPPAGAGVGRFPVVRRALTGYVGDDLWVYNEAAYRIAARPVVDGGQYVGAIVHGMALNGTLAQRLARRIPGASLGFFRGEQLLASYAPTVAGAPGGPDLEATLPAALQDGALGDGSTAPAPVGERAVGVISYLTGSAAHARVGYVIARPKVTVTSPLVLFSEAPESALDAVRWPLVVGVPLLLALLGLLFTFLERDRPFAGWKRAIAALHAGRDTRIDEGAQRGPFRRLAADLNAVLGRISSPASRTASPPKADLDAILGGEPEAKGSYFSLPGQDASAAAPSFAAPAPSAAPASTTSAPIASPALVPPAIAPSAPAPPAPVPPAPVPPEAATPPASRPPTQAAPPAQGRAASLAAAPPPPPPPSRTKDSGTKESGRKDTVPPASGYDPSDFDDHASTTKVADVKAHTGYDPSAFEDDESATKMAEIPDELLEAAKSLASPPSEEAGFRAVYAEFVAMKRRCGEPTDKLRFDRFKKTLTRNRDAILSKHDASTVRFTVYEKNGKAALRATPIK